jgi:hypothetical protein
MGIILVPIGDYSIGGYILVFINGCCINGYWWLFYWWLLIVIILVVIGGYYINVY